MAAVFLKLVNLSISASWLVLAVLVFRTVFRKAPKWSNVLLLGVVALRLMLPFSIESPASLLPSGETIRTDTAQTVPAPAANTVQAEAGAPLADTPHTPIIHSGVPVMIYYGMKVLTPGLFLPVVCILCTLMSTMAGTSWGTLATVGVACMGVAQGLGVPLPVAAGAVCTGAFFGDKVSPLSDSPVITATVCDVPLMEGIRHALISTGPAYLISLIFFFVYGLRYAGGNVGGEVYEDILSTVSAGFWLSPVLLIPVAVVVVLILMKKPTIPTFVAGIAAGALLAMACQGMGLKDILTVMYSGFSVDSGSEVVNSMLNRGGFTSMLSTIGLLIAAGIFGAPLRTAGVVDVLLAFVRKIAKSSRSMSLGVLILHAVFFTITGAYYVSYPVVGGMVKDLYPEYHLDRKNLMRTLLDTGTGLAPMVSWSTTGSYTATTLGVGNLAFLPYAPMLWLSIVFSVIYAVTGIGTAKAKED